MAWSEQARQAAAEARKRNVKPIPGHPYHKKTEAELRYIMKDASEAGKNAQEMGNDRGVNKYADQVNDAATVLGYRARSGAGPDDSNADAARALASGPKSAPAPVHSAFFEPLRESGRKGVSVSAVGNHEAEEYDRDLRLRMRNGQVGSGMKFRG